MEARSTCFIAYFTWIVMFKPPVLRANLGDAVLQKSKLRSPASGAYQSADQYSAERRLLN